MTMRIWRNVSAVVLASLLIGPAALTGSSYWETAAQNCVSTGGDVTEFGQCGGGIIFDNCYESNWAAVCESYCAAGVLDMDGNGPPYSCTCNPC